MQFLAPTAGLIFPFISEPFTSTSSSFCERGEGFYSRVYCILEAGGHLSVDTGGNQDKWALLLTHCINNRFLAKLLPRYSKYQKSVKCTDVSGIYIKECKKCNQDIQRIINESNVSGLMQQM